MLFYKFVLVLSVILMPQFTQESLHPVHVSFGNMEYRPAPKQFHISLRIFANDFTNILEISNKQKINLKIKSSETDEIIDDYIKKNFRIKFDNAAFNPNLLKFEHYVYLDEQEEVVQIFYSYKIKKLPKKIHIMNTLLLDLYRDQKNLLIFSCQNTEKALKFDRNEPDAGFDIQ